MAADEDHIHDAVGRLVLGLLGVACLTMWQGYVLTILWGWFIVPLGAPTIGVAHAVGFAAMFVLRGRGRDDNRTVMQAFLSAVITTALALGVGAIAHAFM